MGNKEKEYQQLENSLEELEETTFDNLTPHSCDRCGKRLMRQEVEDAEDTCSDCLWEETQGLSEEEPEDM